MTNLTLSTTESTSRTQTQTFTIPNMTKFNNVTSNTGSVSVLSISGNQVTVQLTNGAAIRTVQTGGSYTPADTKYVTVSGSGTDGQTMNYSEGGYTGVLTYKTTGQVTINYPAGTFTVEYFLSDEPYATQYGTIYVNGQYLNIQGTRTGKTPTRGDVLKYVEYEYPAGSQTINANIYAFSGNVTKPAIDTRTYVNYYQYNLTFSYETNNTPTITLNTASNKILNENDTMIIDGSASDLDANDVVSVKYQINDNFTQTAASFTSDGISQTLFSKTLTFKSGKLFDGNNAVTAELFEGKTYILKVWSEDDKGGRSFEHTRTFTVMPAVKNKRNPSISVNNKNEVFVVHENYYNTNDIDIAMFRKINNKWLDKDIFTTTAKESSPSTLDDKFLDFDIPPFVYRHDTKVGFYGVLINTTKPSKANIVGIPTVVDPRDIVYLSTSGSGDIYKDTLTYFYEFFDGTVWKEIATDRTINETITHIIPQVIGGVNNARYRIRSFNGKLFSDYTESNTFTINAGPSDVVEVDKIVVNQSYNVSGNGGRKLARLANGWLVAAAVSTETNNTIYFYVNKHDGTGFKQLCKITPGNQTVAENLAIASYNNHIIAVFQKNDGTYDSVYSVEINVPSQTNVDINSSAKLLSSERYLSGTSITLNEEKNEIHVVFASKSATYVNSFNIRYIKGEVNSNGSIFWHKIEQWTTYNTATTYAKNPTIVMNSLNEPLIISEIKTDVGHFIVSMGRGKSTQDTKILKSYTVIATTGSYIQSYPTSMYVPKGINKLPNGRIWVAWHGTDVYSPTVDNIKISYSDNDGMNWSAPKKLQEK